MSALDTAVTLKEVDSVAEGIGKDLDFDVARGNQVLLDQAIRWVVKERLVSSSFFSLSKEKKVYHNSLTPCRR